MSSSLATGSPDKPRISFEPFSSLLPNFFDSSLFDGSLITQLLNNVSASNLSSHMPDLGATFVGDESGDEVYSQPMCLSNLQSEQADKEASMLSPFSTSNKSGNSLPNYGAVNQCPESLTSSGASPLANGSREKVVPINSQVGELEALRGRVALMSHQQTELQAKLVVALEKIQAMVQTEERMNARLSQFEQTYRQQQIEQSRLRHAQDCQLERRLQDYIKASVAQAVQYAMERFIPKRRVAAPEPTRQPSTYIVPDGPHVGYS
ncbi:MAG: hypothetical protein WBC73_19145 [Phormidesmis sp.]